MAVVPPPGRWAEREPADVGCDPGPFRDALDLAADPSSEIDFPGRDLPADHARFIERMPYGKVVGPLRPRGGPSALIVRDGHLVGRVGDTRRTDTTFSVSKSFISTVAGLAVGRGLISSIEDPVARYVTDGTFASEHNADITWRHLLTNTSEWEGELFGKPDVADRRAGPERDLRAPGTFWEYNDVRVNLCAYALLHVFRRPLPEILREAVMDPIGASGTWEWHGYETSWVEIDGERIQSVAGGAHWGGGMIISAEDMARFGLLHLWDGMWEERRLLPEGWVREATTPCPLLPCYGFLWWLNHPVEGEPMWPDCPLEAFAAKGFGGNTIYVDPPNRLVAVTRWIADDAHGEFLRLLMRSCNPSAEEAPA